MDWPKMICHTTKAAVLPELLANILLGIKNGRRHAYDVIVPMAGYFPIAASDFGCHISMAALNNVQVLRICCSVSRTGHAHSRISVVCGGCSHPRGDEPDE